MTDDFKPSSITWVFDQDDFERLLGAITTCIEVVIDLETTGLDEHAVTNGRSNGGVAARIVLASLTLPQADDSEELTPTTWVLPLSHPDSPWRGSWRKVMRDVAERIQSERRRIVNHNVKFDLRWVTALTGVDLTPLLSWDTMLSSSLIDENRNAKLKDRAPETFGIEAWDDVTLNYSGAAEDEDLFDLGVYAARDTYWTWRLAEAHRRQMFVPSARLSEPGEPEFSDEYEDARLGHLARCAVMPMMATLTQMEQRGLALDHDWIVREIETHEEGRLTTFGLLVDRYPQMTSKTASGGQREPSFSPSSLYFREWAQVAVDHGDLRVTAMTPSGRPQWSSAVLTRQARQGSEVAELLLAYRGHVKKLEFLRSWLDKAAPNGRIYATYNAGSVVTGRLSSSGPNMQQVTKSLKPAFIPSPGHYFAELDYCISPKMRVLTSDLRWVEAGNLTEGDKLIGFPEAIGSGSGREHTYQETSVVSLKRLTRPSVFVALSDGRLVACSQEHRWMVLPLKGQGGGRRWVEAQNLRPGDVIPMLVDPWDEPETTQEVDDRAYVRGILDGEGWVTKSALGWGQRPGKVTNATFAASARLGLDWNTSGHLNNGVEQHRALSMRTSLRALGMLRPHRFEDKIRQVWEGRRTYGKHQTGVQVVSVIPTGEQEVIAVGTGTKTMVVEGLLSHNSQIELRIGAFISRCEPMLEAYRNGDDLHTLMAARISGKSPEDVTKAERQAGKAANFGLLYGMGAKGFREYAETAYGVQLTEEEALHVHQSFFEMWEGIGDWHKRAIYTARRDGQIVSPIGRIRRTPNINVDDFKLAAEAERHAINSPVQGFASDLMQMSASSISGNLPVPGKHGPRSDQLPGVPGARIVGTVHDSILVEVPIESWEETSWACKRRMEIIDRYVAATFGVEIDVPLVSDFTVMTRWGADDIKAEK